MGLPFTVLRFEREPTGAAFCAAGIFTVQDGIPRTLGPGLQFERSRTLVPNARHVFFSSNPFFTIAIQHE